MTKPDSSRMAADPSPWTFADESPPVPGDTSVTLVQGSSFMICDRGGDINGRGVAGLFVADTRILSTCTLRVMGRPLEALAVARPSPFAASIVARSADHRILVRRELHVGRGLRADVSLRNLDTDARTVEIAMTVGADLVDLFAVKNGHATGPEAGCIVDGRVLRMTDHSAQRGTIVRPGGNARLADDGTVAWTVTLAPHGEWSTCIEVTAVRGELEIESTYRCGQSVDTATPSRRQATWKAGLPTVTSDVPGLVDAFERAADDLGALRIYDPAFPDDPVVAAGAPWFMTLFGRDSILSAWMALLIDPALGLSTVRALARLQGTVVNDDTEEQPGRILHEVRRNARASLSFAEGDIYYGSVDATPLFVMLVAELHHWGVPLQELPEVLPAVDAALGWIQGAGDLDGDGYVEYQRRNRSGLINQGWKDSWDGISFADGRLPEAPIALAEVQAYVYAAWLGGADLAEAVGDASIADDRRRRADELKARFNRDYWLEDRAAFAVALDADKRPVDADRVEHGPLPVDRHRRRRPGRVGRRVARVARTLLRLGDSNAGNVDGPLRPAQLPQRLGLAPRHRHQHRRAAALPLRHRSPPDHHRPARRRDRIRWPPPGAFRGTDSRRTRRPRPLPGVLLTASMGVRRAAAHRPQPPRSQPRPTPPTNRSRPSPAQRPTAQTRRAPPQPASRRHHRDERIPRPSAGPPRRDSCRAAHPLTVAPPTTADLGGPRSPIDVSSVQLDAGSVRRERNSGYW